MKKLLFTLLMLLAVCSLFAQLPETFDLRDYEGVDYVPAVRSQTSGTCWAHGSLAAVEGNLIMNGNWENYDDDPEPNLAEYHLDWWNGFNSYYNQDLNPPFNNGEGLTVHLGGDYFVTTAYMARLEGLVYSPNANNSGDDDNWFNSAPDRYDDSFTRYYCKDVEWYTAGENLENIDHLKELIMTNGILATCMCYDGSYINGQYEHYQPPTSTDDPNHSVSIIGWDDNRDTDAPENGAWLVRNSWGSNWGYDGYFWISYYDKHATQHPEMGAVTFYNTAVLEYDSVYYHDYHGWRDTLQTTSEAFNAYIAIKDENFVAGSFYTAAANVDFEYIIYDDFDGTALSNQLYIQTGNIANSGLHTIDFSENVYIDEGEDFFVYLKLSDGGIAYDRTSIIPVLLGETKFDLVPSTANEEESYYNDGKGWIDFYNYDDPSGYQNTGNFCIKVITGEDGTSGFDAHNKDVLQGGINSNYPNPFAENTTLSYSVNGSAQISIEVMDLSGRIINILVDDNKEKGQYNVNWNSENFDAGIYVATMKIDGVQVSTIKLLKTK